MNKFKRINFLKEKDVDGVLEQDLLYNYWDLFKIKREVNYYILSREFIGRPDLLSLYLYGSMKYWWIILKINLIDDIWNDMQVGQEIIVPDINDFEDWLIEVISHKREE